MSERAIEVEPASLKLTTTQQQRLLTTLKPTIALLLLASLPYLLWVSNYFVADDWPVLARSKSLLLQEVPQWFLGTRFGWYRPLFDLYIAINWHLFGLSPLGYHIMSILLYALVSATVGILGWLLTGDFKVSIFAFIIFSLHNCHSAVVMWLSSANELLAGFFALVSIVFYILYRQRQRLFWLSLAIVGCILAITAKESALFVPVAFLTYDFLFYSSVTKKKLNLKVFIPTVILLLLVVIHIVLRPPAKASSMHFDVVQLVKNVIYYLAMQLLTIPMKFSEVTNSSLSLVTVFLTAVSLAIIGIFSLTIYKRWFDDKMRLLALVFSVSFTFIALIPVIFVIWERTTFMSSVGIALTLALLLTKVQDSYSKRRRSLQTLILVAFALLISANMLTLIRRNYRWGQAGTANKLVVEQLRDHIDELPSNAEIWLLNLPDRFENAFAFRNSFPKAAEMEGYQQIVYQVLDVELESLSFAEMREYQSQLQARPNVTVLFYKNGDLTSSEKRQ